MRHWLSYHIFIDDYMEDFIVNYLFAFVTAQIGSRVVRRFFFIRYSDGGIHLRARFMLQDGVDQQRLASALYQLVEEFDRDLPRARTSIQVCAYDRNVHYFGHHIWSVYAELLNQCSSDLAFQVLRIRADRRQIRVLVVASIVWFCVTVACSDDLEQLRFFEHAYHFAQKTQLAYGIQRANLSPRQERVFLANLRRTIPIVIEHILGKDRPRQFGRLLRRTLRNATSVGTHAIHLLSNKVGLTLQEESYIYRALSLFNRREIKLISPLPDKS